MLASNTEQLFECTELMADNSLLICNIFSILRPFFVPFLLISECKGSIIWYCWNRSCCLNHLLDVQGVFVPHNPLDAELFPIEIEMEHSEPTQVANLGEVIDLSNDELPVKDSKGQISNGVVIDKVKIWHCVNPHGGVQGPSRVEPKNDLRIGQNLKKLTLQEVEFMTFTTKSAKQKIDTYFRKYKLVESWPK